MQAAGTGNKGERIKWIDMARGIAILFIIIGHCSGIPNSFKHILLSFHVPLFFILNGYLYKKRDRTIWKDFKRLIGPYMLTVLFVMIFCIWKYRGIDNSQMKEIIRSAAYGYGSSREQIKLIGAIWFLPTMFVARRYMNALFSVNCSRQVRTGLALGIMVMGYKVSEYGWIPMNMDIALVAMGFMYVGYMMRETQIRFNKELIISLSMIWIISLNCGSFLMATRLYGSWMNIIGAIAGSVIII